MAFPIRDVFNSIKNLNIYEIYWYLTHLFKAYGVWKISIYVRELTSNEITNPELDGDPLGGQIDAFRHILWMALITQKYGAKTARSIAKTYEKGNKLDYKKKHFIEQNIPDATSMVMDLMNNEIGIEIGLKYPDISILSLISEIKKIILEGKAWKIKKHKNGKVLSCDNYFLSPKAWNGKWNIPKVIVPSNYSFEQKKSKISHTLNSKPNKVISSKI